MSARVAGAYLGEMVEWFSLRMGRSRAIEEVARRARLSPWPVDRLVAGKAKTITTDKFVRIRAAYLDWCLDDLKIAIRQKEERLDAARQHDLLDGLAGEIGKFKARLRQSEKAQT